MDVSYALFSGRLFLRKGSFSPGAIPEGLVWRVALNPTVQPLPCHCAAQASITVTVPLRAEIRWCVVIYIYRTTHRIGEAAGANFGHETSYYDIVLDFSLTCIIFQIRPRAFLSTPFPMHYSHITFQLFTSSLNNK
jgi:hypothetical protein